MDTPLVSIIIPAYNHEPFIEGAVRSALAQDYPNLELLVLDDGSKDNTYARLQQLRPACEKRFARVVFATQPNAGTAVTMSRLVAQCRGKYISACASDDEYLPACISTQVAVLEAHPEAVQTLSRNLFHRIGSVPGFQADSVTCSLCRLLVFVCAACCVYNAECIFLHLVAQFCPFLTVR